MTVRRFQHMVRHPRRTAQFARSARADRGAVAILSASIGRVGSTLTWQALVRSRAAHLMGSYRPIDWRLVSDTCWDLAGYRPRPGTVCKTHDFPYALDPRHRLRSVFLFGRPSDAALSVYRCIATEGMEWVEDHFRHMHANGPVAALLDRDVLRMEEQIEAWRGVTDRDVLCLSYDGLWQHVDALSDFVGFRVNLPARRDRQWDDLPPDVVAHARERYRHLDDEVARLPLCEIVGRR